MLLGIAQGQRAASVDKEAAAPPFAPQADLATVEIVLRNKLIDHAGMGKAEYAHQGGVRDGHVLADNQILLQIQPTKAGEEVDAPAIISATVVAFAAAAKIANAV